MIKNHQKTSMKIIPIINTNHHSIDLLVMSTVIATFNSNNKPEYYIKQLGLNAPFCLLSTKEDVSIAIEKLGTVKPLTFAIAVRDFGHCTISFLGSDSKDSPKYNPSFDDCLDRIRDFLTKMPSEFQISVYACSKFGTVDVALVTFDKKEIHQLIQSTSLKGIQEGSSEIRIPHVSIRIFDDTPLEKKEKILKLKEALPLLKEEDAKKLIRNMLHEHDYE